MAERYYVVREDILPEAILKTIQVKELLSSGGAATVHEAVERAGLSRSAFYKYKDGVYALNEIARERIVTISMDLEHRSGVLSRVLGLIAGQEGNVLTMNQSIPLQGFANVVLSVDISQLAGELSELLELLGRQIGVRKALVIGQG
ncbi:ACT domain-containing protein [Paenibacillus sp. HB172176]|uniref:ACT domain-containing protein n=1 Tax=Paenibacillus sp. HB172176 TaxID=2493690 RepID=UPI00143952A0|nr:ACT domain-containing protein [Paenibacillus sp. HB172176]